MVKVQDRRHVFFIALTHLLQHVLQQIECTGLTDKDTPLRERTQRPEKQTLACRTQRGILVISTSMWEKR